MKPETSTLDVVSEQFDKLAGEASAEPESLEPAAATTPEPGEAAAEPSAADRARDEGGRFVAKKPGAAAKSNGAARPTSSGAQAGAEAGAPEGAPAPEQAAPAAPTAPVLPELKPPQDWRASAKEGFTKAPRAVQEEAIRLYGETRKTLDRAAALEKEIEPWKQAVAPYEHIFRQSGVPPVQAVGSLLRTFAALQTAPGPVRAQIVADIIRTYVGTDEASLTLVGKAIEGGGAAQPREQPAPVGPDQVAELVRQQLASERATSARDAAVRAWQEFEPTVDLLNEEGVRADLADLAGKWQRENPGQTPSKEVFHKLYDRACALNEKAAAIVNQRKEAAAANARRVSTPAAAAGIKNEPAGPGGGGKAKNTEEEVARQYDRLTRPARV